MSKLYDEDGIDGPFDRGMAKNPFEDSARAKKVFKLVVELDRINAACDDTIPDARLPDSLRRMHASWWRALAATAKVNEPSRATIEQVISFYEARARRAS